MDGVKRYTIKLNQLIGAAMVEDPTGRYAQYDAVSTREAAIIRRESLMKEKLADCEKSEAALREELADISAYNDKLNAQCEGMQQRLTAAEQRNVELVELLCDIKRCGTSAINIGGPSIQDRIEAALKPTESGASE